MREISPGAQRLLDKADALSTLYFQQFTNVFNSNQYDYIIGIEGNDEVYYSKLSQHYLDTEKIYFLRCGGKTAVLELIHTLENHKEEIYRNSKCFGIVDRDYNLDNIVCAHRVYVTPVYSFENFFISKKFIVEMLGIFFHLKEFNHFSEDFSRVMRNYEERLSEYINIVKEVDKKYRATRISRQLLRENTPQYKSKNIKISEHTIGVDLSRVILKGDIHDDSITDSYTAQSMSIASSEYEHKTIWDYARDIRGKFLMYFIKSYIKSLFKDSNNNSSTICFLQRTALRESEDAEERKSVFKIAETRLSSDAEFISHFSSCAEVPDCLKIFLKKIKESYA